MSSTILVNTRLNLKFFRRNRVIVGSMLVLMTMFAFSSIPAFLFMSETKHLDIIKGIFSQMHFFMIALTGSLGLFHTSYHLRNRCVKMVFTKPCPPEMWLLSNIFSVALVAFCLTMLLALIGAVLFFVWDLPFQLGMLVMTMRYFCQAMIVLSYIVFLSIIFHPAIALLVILFFQEGTFMGLKFMLSAGIKAAGDSGGAILLKMLKLPVDVIYQMLPTFSPFAEQLDPLDTTMRLGDIDLEYFVLSIAYSVCVVIFFYLLSLVFLKKKRFI